MTPPARNQGGPSLRETRCVWSGCGRRPRNRFAALCRRHLLMAQVARYPQ